MLGGFAGPVFGKISNVQKNDNAAFLPSSAESTKVSKITVKFNEQSNNSIPTLLKAILMNSLIVWFSPVDIT